MTFSPWIAGAHRNPGWRTHRVVVFIPSRMSFSKSLIGSTVYHDFAPKTAAAPDIGKRRSFLADGSDIHLVTWSLIPLPFAEIQFLPPKFARSASNPTPSAGVDR